MGKRKPLVKRILGWIFVRIPVTLSVLSLLWVVVLKWCPVWYTPLMLQRTIEYRKDADFQTYKTWKPLRNITPRLVKAVIASEDNLFNEHRGFDWKAINEAIEESQSGKRFRGGSTISQQTAKNVFLFPGKSRTSKWIRKGFETYFTVLIELVWGKERIMEVYLNVAEMGKGIYGAQAAARHIFDTDASRLTERQCCLVAACLPNPLKRNAGHPGPYVRSRATAIASLQRKLAYPAWLDYVPTDE